MMTKFENSWLLFKASVTVTLRHRKLLWFPVVNALCTAFIAVFFLTAMALPFALHPTGYHLNQKQHWVALKDYYLPEPAAQPRLHYRATTPYRALSLLVTGRTPGGDKLENPAETAGFPWGSLCLAATYFLSMFLATFFNVAFYNEIIEALNGRGVSLRRGFAVARRRLPSILAWSLLAGVVGWIIRAIEQRLPLAGRIVAGFIGMAWSVAAVFAIPVIVRQPTPNPLKILQQSALTLKRTWGEGLIGYLGLSAGSAVVFAVSFLPVLFIGLIALFFHSVWLIAIAAAVWVVGILLASYVSSVGSNVYRCALYLYAAEGVVPEPYNRELLDMAWKVKGGCGKH